MIIKFPDGTVKTYPFGSNVRGLSHRGIRPWYIAYSAKEVRDFPMSDIATKKYQQTMLYPLVSSAKKVIYYYNSDTDTYIIDAREISQDE